MRDLARNLTPALFAFLKGIRLLVDKESFLVSSGLIHSYKTDKPCKADGSPLPWMNYNVIAFLEERLNQDMLLFEYGSGYSSLFYASLVSQVVSVEHDREWYETLKPILPPNVDLLFSPLSGADTYCRSVLATKRKYQVVVIDGRKRVECVQAARQALASDGVIIFDDTQRARYAGGLQTLHSYGFKSLDWIGFKPTGIEMDQTSIFYRPGNCLNI